MTSVSMDVLLTSESSPWAPAQVIIPTILLVTTLSAVLFSYYRSWKRLAHIPGPAAAHLSILWLLRRAWRKELFPCMIEAGNKYGQSLNTMTP